MTTSANEQARRSVTSLEAMKVFARRSEHGLSDCMWYALEALPCMVESNDASAFCVRFGLSQEDLDALLSEGRYLTGDKVPTFKAILERYLPKFSKGGKTQVHEDDLGLIEEDTGTICEKCATKLGE